MQLRLAESPLAIKLFSEMRHANKRYFLIEDSNEKNPDKEFIQKSIEALKTSYNYLKQHIQKVRVVFSSDPEKTIQYIKNVLKELGLPENKIKEAEQKLSKFLESVIEKTPATKQQKSFFQRYKKLIIFGIILAILAGVIIYYLRKRQKTAATESILPVLEEVDSEGIRVPTNPKELIKKSAEGIIALTRTADQTSNATVKKVADIIVIVAIVAVLFLLGIIFGCFVFKILLRLDALIKRKKYDEYVRDLQSIIDHFGSVAESKKDDAKLLRLLSQQLGPFTKVFLNLVYAIGKLLKADMPGGVFDLFYYAKCIMDIKLNQ